jgi:mono/diheme cytochrome c family protein
VIQGLAFLLLLLLPAVTSASPQQVQQFLSTYCIQCHGASAQMGQRRFDKLQVTAKDVDTQLLLQDIVDQLNLSQMPPAKLRQPDPAQKQAVIATLTQAIADAHAQRTSTGAQTVLRRLNRREYRNTIGDLLQLNMTMFDPTSTFPRDQVAGHMDNIGDALVTSGYLLEQYLDAADQAIEKALRTAGTAEPPKEQTWVFNSGFRQQQELDYAQRQVYEQRYLCLYETTNSLRHEGAYAPLHAFSQGVPADGHYEIRVRAEALNRLHPYNQAMFAMDRDAPFRLGIVPGNAKAGPLHHPQPIEPQLGEVTLRENGPEWYTFRIWLDAGYTPRFTFPNGMIDSRKVFMQIIARHRDLLPPEQQKTAEPRIYPARPVVLRYGKMPHIRIHEVQIRGPLYDAWPLPSVRAILGDKPFQPERTRELLQSFATRAYRRPARPDEVDRLLAVVQRRRTEGLSPIDAFKDGLKAALASPAFLYLHDAAPPASDGRLPAHALATRLSYFLWSSAPDDELMRLAHNGDLRKPEVLRAQTRRLLASPRSQTFLEGFLDSWLNLRSLGDMPPDRDTFSRYYEQDLQAAMRRETQLFTRHLLDHNQSIVQFLDSDIAFVNKPLARLYGLDNESFPPDQGHLFRQVKLSDPRRGGLLGQGSVLTVTANGLETSPVTRGVWLLENILGTPPSPPPDNVPPIDPDVRGATTMRDILTKHRDNPSCFACHQKIDPPGFALESFDPIGRWRATYKNGAPIDASGQLPGSQPFQDVTGLKKILVERKPQFARMLTERVLSYACGRRIERIDRPHIDRLVAELARRGDGFRDLIELAVLSDLFQKK